MSDNAEFEFECPNCQQRIKADAQMGGTQVACPVCEQQIEVPSPAVTEPDQEQPNAAPSAAPKPKPRVIVTTGNEISGQTIVDYLGIARGLVVRSPKASESLFGGLERMIGGDNDTYSAICDQARQRAFDKMIEHAREMTADAVIAFRYDATEFAAGITEVLAYGTAVRLAAV